MKVHDDLFRICGVVDKKEFAWIPHTEHKLVDYKIEPPIYRLYVEVNGAVLEFKHPINEGLDYLRNNIQGHVNKVKTRRSNAKIITV